jgi:murein DD-endopeptidase MepM/ murein hydrolase activator NlpD
MVLRLWLIVSYSLFWVSSSVFCQSQAPQARGTRRLAEIQAPKEQPRKDLLEALSKSEQDEISKSAVPVLILPNIREFEKRNVVVREIYYTAFFTDGKQFISIQGSRMAYSYPQLEAAPNAGKTRVRSTEGFVTESERIWTASWKEFGAAYLLSLECADEKDKRCQSPEYTSQLTKSLVYVGGGQGKIGTPLPTTREQPKGTNDFSYNPPGQLVPGSGTGRQDDTVYAPGIRFPIENKPDYANSQVWNPGGSQGPPGGNQCDPKNYSYPWWDNFCEARTYVTPMCPAGSGHQGQDVRPSTCEKDKHPAVSATDGTVMHIGSYTVFITAPDGTQYRYLHMGSVEVKVGSNVSKGERIGRVSNVFGSTSTTIHLHFEILQNVANLGFTHVPPYLSLVKAYENLP